MRLVRRETIGTQELDGTKPSKGRIELARFGLTGAPFFPFGTASGGDPPIPVVAGPNHFEIGRPFNRKGVQNGRPVLVSEEQLAQDTHISEHKAGAMSATWIGASSHISDQCDSRSREFGGPRVAV